MNELSWSADSNKVYNGERAGGLTTGYGNSRLIYGPVRHKSYGASLNGHSYRI